MTLPFSPPPLMSKGKPKETVKETAPATPTGAVPPQTAPLDVGKDPETGMFRYRAIFAPEDRDNVSNRQIVELLSALGIILDPIIFERLPESVKGLFLIQDRASRAPFRYGTEEWDRSGLEK